MKFAATQILRHNIVGIGGGDEPGYWQADALGEKFPPSDFQKFPLGTETISGTDATGNWRRRRRDKTFAGEAGRY